MKRKVLASFLALMMVFSMLPTSAFAAETECAHEHTEEEVREATCTTPQRVVLHCHDCEQDIKILQDDLSPALGHDMVVDETLPGYKAATCTEGGLDTRKCSRCDVTDSVESAPLGHKWSEKEVVKEADCVNPAGVERTCERCGETERVPLRASWLSLHWAMCSRRRLLRPPVRMRAIPSTSAAAAATATRMLWFPPTVLPIHPLLERSCGLQPALQRALPTMCARFAA